MIPIFDFAKKVADELSDLDAEVSMTPDFELSKMKERRVVVVPAERKVKIQSRMTRQLTYTIDVGVVCRTRKDDERSFLLEVSENIGERFLSRNIDGMVCVSSSWEPLYSVESLRANSSFISVVRLVFTGF